jgi:hypothetical protein
MERKRERGWGEREREKGRGQGEGGKEIAYIKREIRMNSGLYQGQVPGIDVVLYLGMMFPWGEVGCRCTGPSCTIFVTSCKSVMFHDFKNSMEKIKCVIKSG